ncbi:MAG: sulfatase-like hydrolase/transferase [bacterium]|nr:sulfatase-like hydrolase/transferase [bacterium]
MAEDRNRPNIVLVMADDQGWGQTGYYDHPILKTSNLDEMAENGLRFDRFYAGAPNCSPTRSTVMTGRSNDRTGVFDHGYALRLQEKTVVQAFQQAGYTTGHFGKWHLSGFRGPGAPILAEDPRHPGHFGFDEWLSVTNFFDRDPLMSRKGVFEEFEGDSSDVAVGEAIQFIQAQEDAGKPSFTVIWYGSPHAPWIAGPEDKQDFGHLSDIEQNHYGELAAMDRSIGTLRGALREMGIAQNTLVWFCSDNGGLKPFGPATVGGLRGWKGTMFEGGLRVPAIIEWPDGIPNPRITSYPAATMDMFPTLIDICGIDESVLIHPQDGISLKPLFGGEIGPRETPLPFRHTGRGALIDNDFKIILEDVYGDEVQLYNLAEDANETTNLAEDQPEVADRMKKILVEWSRTVDASNEGRDYSEGKITIPNPPRRDWIEDTSYAPYLEQLKERPEYKDRILQVQQGQ